MKLGHTIDETRAKCPELTDEILDELRAWSEELEIPGIPDEHLAMFAHSCYFDVEAAKRCMKVYYRMRSTVPEFFRNRDPRSDGVQQALKTIEFANLPVPDDNGNRILFNRLIDTRPSSLMLNEAIKLFVMSVDAILYNDTSVAGYIILMDMTGVRIGHLTRLSLDSVRRLFEYLQEGIPIRLKAIHVFNAVWFIERIMSILKPFMSRELFDMLHFYSGDVSEHYDIIPPKCLPKDYGGELESVASINEDLRTRLDQLRDHFIEEESLFRCWSPSSSEDDKSSTASNSKTADKKGNGTITSETLTTK